MNPHLPRGAALALATLLLLCACRRMRPLFYTYHYEPSCLSSQYERLGRDCPLPRSIPPCPDGLGAASIEETTAQAETLLGRHINVRGNLNHGFGSCTQNTCLQGCCNTCRSSFILGTEEAIRYHDAEHRKRTLLLLDAPDLGCRGDESVICCDVEAAGQEVIARGLLQSATTTYSLHEATLCTPPAPPPP